MSTAFKSLVDRVTPGAAPTTTPAPRIVTLPPSAFGEAWKARPRDVSRVGLRLISEDEYAEATRNASREAWRLFHDERDADRRSEAFDAALKREVLVFAMCEAGNVEAPYFKQTPNATITVALRIETIARLFEELEQLAASANPLVAEASDDQLLELGVTLMQLTDPTVAASLTPEAASRLRRLATYLATDLAEAGVKPPQPV